MACWRVLELSDLPDDSSVPQLLVKTVFGESSYIVHLTCLSNIWSEELDLEGLVARASKEQSPIEVSKQDTAQLAILLGNIEKSLTGSEDATCHISQTSHDQITLNTSIALPAPLDSLTWKFELKKRTSATLKNELILPLLVSSHIQHDRMTSLASIISEKDKAIARLVDQFESSNLDLAAAFPVLSSLKAGRRAVKRDQAIKHIPALRPFSLEPFKTETASLRASNITTFGLFQEALSECNPTVPSGLKTDPNDIQWWTALPKQSSYVHRYPKSKQKKASNLAPADSVKSESGEEETEDEFEVHENFKNRNIPSRASNVADKQSKSSPDVITKGKDDNESDLTDDEDDLDAPPRSQNHNIRSHQASESGEPHVGKHSSSLPTHGTSPMSKAKSRNFRIGGKSKSASNQEAVVPSEKEASPLRDPLSQGIAGLDATPKRSKKVFKIGGKGKGTGNERQEHGQIEALNTNRTEATQPGEPPSSPPNIESSKKPDIVKEDLLKESAEQKAERRREDLKRKTAEAAKKQAQQKRKRRF